MNDTLSEVVGHYQKGMHFGEVTFKYIVPSNINHFDTASVADAVGTAMRKSCQFIAKWHLGPAL